MRQKNYRIFIFFIFSFTHFLSYSQVLDYSFLPTPGFNSFVNAIATQPDGKIIVGGNFTTYNGIGANRIVRINPDGTHDNTFNASVDAAVRTIAIQSDGKILIGGDFTIVNGGSKIALERLNADGTSDGSFVQGLGFPNTSVVNSIAIQTDDKIVVGGGFITYNGTSRNRIVRINADGTLDVSFNPGTGADNTILAVTVQTDGNIVAVGSFLNFAGQTKNRIVRLTPGGIIDAAFTASIVSGNANCITLQPDGKILVGGSFTSPASRIVRLMPGNGSVDGSFVANADNYVNCIKVQPDGKILVGGFFTTINGSTAKYFTRLNSDGSPDLPFSSYPGGAGDEIRAAALLPDGRIYIGGYLIDYNSVPRQNIARIFGGQVVVGAVAPTAYCGGTALTVPYSAIGDFSAGNTFSVELSDDLGNFGPTPPVIGSITTGSLSGSISCTVPNAIPYSASYRLRIVSSDIFVVGEPSVSMLELNPAPANPGTISGPANFCANQTGVVYSISPAIGASTYTWSVPGDATIFSGSGTPSITVDFGVGSGNICVTPSNVNGSLTCNAATECMAVTFSSCNKTFTGSSTAFWSDGNSWSPIGVPLITDDVTIDANCTINSAGAVCKNMTINGGYTLTIDNVSFTNDGYADGGGNLNMIGALSEWSIAGNTLISGSIGRTDGTIRFYGSGFQQVIAGSYNNIKIDPPSPETVIQTGDITVNGNLEILSGIFSTGGNNISIAGDWLNNAIFNQGASILTFSGVTNQQIGGSPPVKFTNLTINKGGSDIIVNAEIQIDGVLDFLGDGKLVLGTNSLILGPAATIPARTFSSSRMIELNGVKGTGGNVIKEATNSSEVLGLYPIGLAGFYTPVQITGGTFSFSGTGSVSMEPLDYLSFFAGTGYAKRFISFYTSNVTSIADFQFSYNFGNAPLDIINSPTDVTRYVSGVPYVVTGAFTNSGSYTYGVNATGNNDIDGDWVWEALSVPPTISGYPAAACIGSVVTITGTGFTGTSDVTINGTSVGAGGFIEVSDTQLDITIPLGASTGLIDVTTLAGTGTSASSITINPSVTPDITITQTVGSSTICAGTLASFEATTVNGGGATPGYQWMINASPVPLENGSVFNTNGLVDTDVVSCELTSSDACASPLTALSNTIAMTVVTPPVVNITNPAAVCSPAIVDLTDVAIVATSTGVSIYDYFDTDGTTPLVSPNNISVSGVYYIKGSDGFGCYDTDPVTVTINTGPNLGLGYSGGVSCGGETGTVSINTSENLTVYQAYVGGVPVGPSQVGNWGYIEFPITPAYISNPNTFVQIEATLNGCTGILGTPAISYQNKPTATTTPSGSINICAGDNVVLTETSATGSFFQWYDGSTDIPGETLSSYTATAAGTYSVILSDGTCSDTSAAVTVVVDPIPVTSAITGSASECENATGVSYSVVNTAGSTYAWTITNGTQVSGTNTNAITVDWATGAGNVSVVETSAGLCVGAAVNLPVTLSPAPSTSAITGSASECENATGVSYSVINTAGSTYAWTITNGTQVSGTNTNAITVDWASGAGNVSVVETSAGLCVGAVVNLPVTLSAAPVTSAITGSASECENATGVSYSVINTAGSTYTWTITNGTQVSGTNTNAITVDWGAAGAGDVSVVETSAGLCVGAVVNLPVTLSAAPVTSAITGSASECENATGVSYSVINTAGSTYAWTITNGTQVSGTNTNAITVDWASGAGDVSVVETSAGLCVGAAVNLPVTLSAAPVTSAIAGSASECANATGVSYSVVNTAGSTYAWTITNGTQVSGTNTNAITVDWASGAGDVSVVETSAGLCVGAAVNLPVTLSAAPVTSAIAGSASECENATGVSYSVINTAGSTYTWTITNGTQVSGTNTNAITVDWGAAGAGDVSVVETSAGLCVGTAVNLPVTINTGPIPAIPVSPAVDTVCVGADGLIMLTGSEVGVMYQAEVGAVPVGSPVAGGGNISIVIADADLANGVNTITVRATRAGCPSVLLSGSSSISKSSITAPSITIAGTQLCNGAALNLSVPAGFATYQWYMGASMIVGETTPVYVPVTPTSYQVEVSDLLCKVKSPAASVTTAGADPVISSSGNLLSVPSGAPYYQWYAVSPSGSRAIYGANTSSYQSYYNANYFVAVNFNNCRLVSLPFTVGNGSFTALSKMNFQTNDSMIFIAPPSFDENIELYPNPAEDAFMVAYKTSNPSVVVELYNSMGKKITSKSCAAYGGNISERFEDMDLQPGIYLIHIIDGDQKVVRNIQIN